MRVPEKVVIVTGAGRGIGEAISLRLAEEGANTVLVDISDEVNGVAERIAGMGRGVLVVKADVSDRAQVQAVIDQAIARFGQIDILVNNAGISRNATIKNMSQEYWDVVINVNLKGPFNCLQAVVPHMTLRRYGKVVNIASLAILGYAVHASYSASKGGVTALTRTAALELGRHGINVNAVAPGYIETPMTSIVPPDAKEGVIKDTPLGRVGEPLDIANLVLFLASDEASYITGQTIFCCGGRSIAATPW